MSQQFIIVRKHHELVVLVWCNEGAALVGPGEENLKDSFLVSLLHKSSLEM